MRFILGELFDTWSWQPNDRKWFWLDGIESCCVRGEGSSKSICVRRFFPSPLFLFRFHFSPFPQKRLILRLEENEHSSLRERIGLCRAFTRRLCPKRTMQSLSLLLECHSQFSHWGDFSCNFCCNFNRRSHVIFGPALGQPSPVGNGWWRPKVKFFSWFLFLLIKKAFSAVVFHLF